MNRQAVRDAVLLFLVMLSAGPMKADEFPPFCAIAEGGQGDLSVGAIHFPNRSAHLGDTVQIFASLGMGAGACQTIQATGSIYIATGLLTNFLENVTLDPNFIYQCPTNTTPPCSPGPYLVTLTPALVGASVTSPLGSVPGVPGFVRAVQNGVGMVRIGEVLEPLRHFHGSSIQIFAPSIQVAADGDLPIGASCFPTNGLVRIHGTVTNRGDITLTNVLANDSRAGALVLLRPITGLPLNPGMPTGPVSLAVGAYATFTASFAPTSEEIATGSATNIVTVRGTDTSDFGGPRASVTNSVNVVCPLCGPSARPGRLSLLRANQNMVLNWTGTYHLQTASNIAGPYSDVPAVLSGPYTNAFGPPSGRFLRLRE